VSQVQQIFHSVTGEHIAKIYQVAEDATWWVVIYKNGTYYRRIAFPGRNIQQAIEKEYNKL